MCSTNIISMDVETMRSSLGDVQIPILISIAYRVNTGEIKALKFMIDNNVIQHKGVKFACNLLWSELFNFISENISPKSVIFSHNLGGFDGFFLFQGLLNNLDRKNIHTIIDKDNNFIQITATIKGNKYVWRDSMRIFPVSLDKLCKSMGVDGKISKYDQRFNEFSLFNDDILLNQFIEYSLQDSIALFTAMERAQELYLQNYQVDIGTIWSTSTLSLKIFRSKFLKETINSLTMKTDRYVREAYFGGATDHYKMYGEKLYYYDVNSLYPYVMLNDMPIEEIGYHDDLSSWNLESFFGFCLAEIECPKDINIPLLPYRTVDNEVIYPTGKWTGIYFSEQLKAVIPHGYKIKLINGIEFTKDKIFTEYVNHFYEIKENSSGAERFLAKMQLNQLYGYFGRSQEILVTANVNKHELEDLLLSRVVDKVIELDNEIFVVLMLGNLNDTMLNKISTNVDFKNFKRLERSVKSHVGIAAAVTSDAQIEMIKYKTLPGYNCYYSDTDSVFLDKALPEELIGNEIGEMKNELESLNAEYIDKAYFLGNKKYGYIYTDKDNIQRTSTVIAGADRNSLNFEDIESLSEGHTITKQYANTFNRNFNKMEITIKARTLNIHATTDKQLINNSYVSPYILNLTSDRDNRSRIAKLLNKLKLFLRKFSTHK